MRALLRHCPIWAGIILLILIVMPARAADGHAELVAQFTSGGVTAEIYTYEENTTVVALVQFKANGTGVNFAFDKNDWPALERLWESAKAQAGEKYVSVGTLSETGTTEKCVISAAAGPSIRLTITSPTKGALMFDMPMSMVPEFDAKLREAASVTTPS